MMKKKPTFKITIPEPCHENWQEMTPEAKGRFCQKCEKTVHDFSGKSDREIAKTYQKNNGKICGRFRPAQLNRRIPLVAENNSNNRFTTAGLLLSGMLTVANVQAQNCTSISTIGKIALVEEHNPKSNKPQQIKKRPKTPITITGEVTDEENLPLIGTSILVKGTAFGTISDIDGTFELKIPETFEADTAVLVISYTGYESKEIPLNLIEGKLEPLKIILKEGPYCSSMMGIIVIQRDQTLFQLTKNFIRNFKYKFRKRKERRQEEIAAKKLEKEENEKIEPTPIEPQILLKPKIIQKIYPNPFVNALNIEIHAPTGTTLVFKLFDENGQELFSQKNEVLEGNNSIEMNLYHKTLRDGSYFLSVFENGEIVQTEMVVKFVGGE